MLSTSSGARRPTPTPRNGGAWVTGSLFALNVLPIDWAGGALLLVGILMMAAEAFTPTFGVLGVAGAMAFAAGSVIMFDTDVPGFGISPWVVATVTLLSGALLVLGLAMVVRSRTGKATIGGESLAGRDGKVVSWSGTSGRVRVEGDVWQARSAAPLEAGDTVRVIDRDRLTLTVEPDVEKPAPDKAQTTRSH